MPLKKEQHVNRVLFFFKINQLNPALTTLLQEINIGT